MDLLYNDLENYDDVETLNRLKNENVDLTRQLEYCNANMQKLQKDFDKLEAEFKKLETNYSSLLKISRAEIQRKTEMITNLNIEKDLLVIKAVQNGPAHKVQELIRNVRDETGFKRKKKPRNKGPKGREQLLRRNTSHPQSPAPSSTATDNSYKVLGSETVADNSKSSRLDTKENELQKHEVFPDNRPSSPVANKRVSVLSRPHLSKLSSDEEFEDMYSALKPKASREPERTRKRGRDDSQDEKMLYNSPLDRPVNYPDPFRERFTRNRAGRFSDTERISTREKHLNDPDRNIIKGKHNYDRNKNVSDSLHHRFSPERHHRGTKELGEDRIRNRRLESPPRERRRLESPPRERHRLGSPPQERQPIRNRIRERRKSYHGRSGNYPEVHSVIHKIHGEYGEPQSKRPRIEIPVHHEERRPSESQYHNESPPNVGNIGRTCRSPDFSHTEESSNEPVVAQTETRSRPPVRTPTPVLDDPRLSSDRYIQCSEGNKHILQSAHANDISLQPVDKSLWNLEEVHVPKALRSKPLEISEELVDEMDVDKPVSVKSLEDGEIGSDTYDTALDDIYDFEEFNKQIANRNDRENHRNDSQKVEIKRHKEQSPVDMLQDFEKGSHAKTRLKTKEKVKSRRDEESVVTSKDSQEVDTKSHYDNPLLPSVLQKLIHSMNEEHPEGDNTVKKENESKQVTASRISNKSEKSIAKIKDDRENLNESDNKKADKLEKRPVREPKQLAVSSVPNDSEKSSPRTADNGENENQSDLETGDKTDKHERRSEKEPKRISAYKIPKKSEKLGSNTKDERENQNKLELHADYNKTDNLKKYSKRESKRLAAPRIPTKSVNVGSKTRGNRESSNESELETNKKKTDRPKKRSDKESKQKSSSGKELESELSDKPEKERLKSNDKIAHQNIPDVKKTVEKLTQKSSEEIELHAEAEISDGTEKASSKIKKIERKNVSELIVKEKPAKETVETVVFHEFEHRVYSRHIVEGDLELSDESNDETQLKIEEKNEEKKKISSKRKSHRGPSKDKRVDSEETTRSQKDTEKERKSMNKFSELFGDSSSLITPEDLNLATRTAHGLPADCCPPAAEDAQDSIIEPGTPAKPQTTNIYPKDFTESLGKPTFAENTFKPKDLKDRTRTKHKQNKDVDGTIVSNNTHGDTVEQVGELSKRTVESSAADENLVSNTNNHTNQTDVSKLDEKVKESSKSNKRPKTKGEKKLSVSENTEETNSHNVYVAEPSSNSPTPSDNKENSSSNGNSERNISNEMARIFENQIVVNKISSTDVNEVNKEMPQLSESTKETNCSSGIQDVPNLAPAVDEPGLVTTVVISTGVQPIASNAAQYASPFGALASSTPAKDLSAIDISSEIEPKLSHSAQVSVTISRDDSTSQPEDAPDMRITCVRRRRRVLKR